MVDFYADEEQNVLLCDVVASLAKPWTRMKEKPFVTFTAIYMQATPQTTLLLLSWLFEE